MTLQPMIPRIVSTKNEEDYFLKTQEIQKLIVS